MSENKIIDFSSYSDKELNDLKEKVDEKRTQIINDCAKEMSKFLSNDSFDQYSFFGKRKIKKVAEKYANLLDGADGYEDLIDKELLDRGTSVQKYSSRSLRKEVSTEEFLQQEAEKTWAHKSKIE